MNQNEEFITAYQADRKQTSSLKWDALEERFGDSSLLPLWVADMEFRTPDTVVTALTERIQHGVFGYSQNLEDYFTAFAAWQKKRHQVVLEREWLRFSNGVVQSLYHLIHCFTDEGDGVLIQPPVYYPFFNAVKDTRRKLVTAPLELVAGEYRMDVEKFATEVSFHHPKLFILCSPHNPVGRIWREEELAKVLEICRQNQVLVVADEIHQDFELSGRSFISTLNVSNGAFKNNLIVVNAPSKSFNLASLLHSHVIIPNDKLRQIYDERIKAYAQTENNLLGQLAGRVAYETGEEWFDSLLEVIRGNYRLLQERLSKIPAIKLAPLEGTYLAWLDMREVLPAEDIHHWVQEKAKLAVDYGEWFAPEYQGFIRLNLATTPENVEQAVQQLLAAVKEAENGV